MFTPSIALSRGEGFLSRIVMKLLITLELMHKKEKEMKQAFVLTLAVLFVASVAFAESSGNFSATAIPATCAIGSDGALTGGTGITVWSSLISTSNGNGVTLKITPSAVTGLFTRTKIDTTVSTATADVGIEFCVEVDGSGDGVLPNSCVVYDQRFQQISSQLFSQIAACNTVVCTTSADCATAGLTGATCINPTGLTGGGVCVVPTTTACTTNADCAVGQLCVNPTGGAGAGLCNQVAGVANPNCDFELILSTLSAHSFDFVVPVGLGKPHTVTATWKVIGAGTKGDASTAYCVGPGILTVEQTKLFNNSGSLIILQE
jgi:hypothetical protein